MDLLQRIQAIVPQLTPGERLAAEYILAYPFDAVRFPSSTLADNANTSRSNVVRFCQKLGFAGYAEFKFELNHTLQGMKRTPATQSTDVPTVLQKYLTSFAQLDAFYHSTQLQEVARALAQARRILVLGRDHSSLSAQQLAFRLARSGLDASALSMASMMGAFTPMVTQQDVVVVVSLQGRKESYEDVLVDYQARGVKIILITITKRPPITGYVDHLLVLPSPAHDYSSDMLDDAPTLYLFVEMLIEAIHALPTTPLS